MSHPWFGASAPRTYRVSSINLDLSASLSPGRDYAAAIAGRDPLTHDPLAVMLMTAAHAAPAPARGPVVSSNTISVAEAIPDRDALIGQPFSFQVPDATFADADDAALHYRAHLANGDPLPDWLKFHHATHAFKGTPPADFSGHLDIVVTASDGTHHADDTFRLNVRHHDDAPVAQAVADQAIAEDHAWNFTLPAGTFSDDDSHGLLLHANLANGYPLPSWLHFDSATQTFSGTPPQDFNGALDLVVTADDGAESASSEFHLTIHPREDAPVATEGLQAQYANEETPFSFAIPHGAFVDPDGDALTYSATLANGDALPDWLHFDATTQTFSGTAPPDFYGAVGVKVTASDGTQATSNDFTLNVLNVDDAPVLAAAIADDHITAGQAFGFKLAPGTFTDVDSTKLTYSATMADGSALPGWLQFNPLTQTFTGTPPADFDGSVLVSVHVSDGTTTASGSFTLADKATFVDHAIEDQTVGEVPTWTFHVPDGTFKDFDSSNLTYSATLANGDALPDWLSFDSATQTFSGSPPEGWSGHEDIKVTASDGTHSASDTFALDQKGDFSYVIDGSSWGRSAPSEIHYLFNSLYWETSGSVGGGFDVGFSDDFGDSAGVSGSVNLNYAMQAGLLIDFTLKPDTISLTDSFDVHHTVNDTTPNSPVTIDVTGETEDTTKFHSETPSDAFFLHAFAGLTATANVELAGGAHVSVLGLGGSAGFDTTFDLPGIPKITVANGQITNPGDAGAIDVTVQTGDPAFTLDLDKSGIGHIIIGPPSMTNTDSFTLIDPDQNGGLGTMYSETISDPFLGASLDLDALAIKIRPILSALFHFKESEDFGIGSAGVSVDSDFALVGDLSFGKITEFTPEIDYTMTSSLGQTITGKAGDQAQFDTPEGEGDFTVNATYTTQAHLQTTLFLQGNLHFDYSVLQAALHLNVGYGGDFGVSWDYPFNALLSGSQNIIGFAIAIYTSSDYYTLDQSKQETYSLHYENFRTVQFSGPTFTFTTHQLTAVLSFEDDTITCNALDNVLDGKFGTDKLYGLDGNDNLYGNTGDDFLYGGKGHDILTGGLGNDFIQAGNDGSTIDGGDGNDIIRAGTGDDTITDLLGTVDIKDAGGNNTITLGDLGYKISFLNGNNMLTTGAGNDTLHLGDGNDIVHAGDGTNIVYGGEGNNAMDGGAGVDKFYGGSGDDYSKAYGGNDILMLGDGNNTAFGYDGNDTIVTGSGHDQIEGDAGNDTITVGDGQNNVTGDDGNDIIVSGSGNDSLAGGTGNDTITGGGGSDFIFGNDGRDVYVYNGVADSTGVGRDWIADFDAKHDEIDLPTAVAGIDHRRSGDVASATFDQNLMHIASAAHLAAGHAVMVVATGELAGEAFLVIDANGVAGYQATEDYVIRMDSAAAAHISTADFI